MGCPFPRSSLQSGQISTDRSSDYRPARAVHASARADSAHRSTTSGFETGSVPVVTRSPSPIHSTPVGALLTACPHRADSRAAPADHLEGGSAAAWNRFDEGPCLSLSAAVKEACGHAGDRARGDRGWQPAPVRRGGNQRVRGPRVRDGRRRLRREFHSPPRAGRRMLRLRPRRKGGRPLGRNPRQGDRRAVGTGHDGRRVLHDQGTLGHDVGTRELARLARLRRARVHLLAGVWPAR